MRRDALVLVCVPLLAALAAVVVGVSLPRTAVFPADGRADYQLGGAYPPPAGTTIVSRDVTSRPAPGVFSICYVNAFQTQPGEDLAALDGAVLRDADGHVFRDADWPDERILDTSSTSSRRIVTRRDDALVDECARRGFEAVEPDNLDTYTRDYARAGATHRLTRAGNAAVLAAIARRAHAHRMLVAQKNAAEDSAYLHRVAHADLAVAEECQRYRRDDGEPECRAYTDVYGSHVVEIEYSDVPHAAAVFRAACAARGADIPVVYRDRDVVPRGRRGYVDRACAGR